MTEPMRRPPEIRDETDQLIDGLLDAAARERYEAGLGQDQAARDDLARQERVDAALRSLFEPGPAPELDLSAADRPLPIEARAEWKRWLGVAAAVLLVGLGVWAAVSMTGGPDGLSARGVYESLVANDFRPEEVCTDPDKFEAYVKGRAGQGLRLDAQATGIRLVGWAYAQAGKAPRVVVLMVYDREKPSIVFITPANMDQPVALPPAGSGLSLFERRVGRLVLREVTPHAEPGVVPHLEVTR